MTEIKSIRKAVAASNPEQPPPGEVHAEPPKMSALESLISWAKNVKEVLTLGAFFVGALAWLVGYFATRDALDQLRCYTQVNVRMLQANENQNYSEQLAKQSRRELRDEQRMLETATPEGRKTIQDRIDDLTAQVASFSKTVDAEKSTAKKALDTLTANMCLVKEDRTKLLEQLSSGNF